MKRIIIGTLLLFQVGFSADFMSLPFTFAARQLISASKIMANYNALRNAIIDGSKKINVNEVWTNGSRIIDSSGNVTGVKGTFTGAVSGTTSTMTSTTTGTTATYSGAFTINNTLTVTGNAAMTKLNPTEFVADAPTTLTDADTTPGVTDNYNFETGTTGATLTDFIGGEEGQEIRIISKGAIVYDVTTSGLKCGTTDITTASGDVVRWYYDGTDWICETVILAANDYS